MSEIVVNALMLRATSYGENDKILTLLTAELGKISAGIKGVKKAGAKLKFAAQPFCFAEYVLAARAGRYTVINASERESFYDLRTDIGRFYAASAAIEAADALTYEGDDCRGVFADCIKALSQMCGGGEREALIKFLLSALQQSGYGISAEVCPDCGARLSDSDVMRFDMDRGTFTCAECGGGQGASRVTYNTIRRAQGRIYDHGSITPDGEKRALRLLREYFSYKLGISFNSLSEYIRLI